jgi:hypothetical protein
MAFGPEVLAGRSPPGPLREEQLVRVELAGELDVATVPEFEAALPHPAAGEGSRSICAMSRSSIPRAYMP